MIPQEIIDKILDKVSIAGLIGRYTEVKRSGRNSMALCPFHGEKTPSFSISEEKGLYHCFGCGASGNAVRFLMDFKKLTFVEALYELAKEVGIDLAMYEDKASSTEPKGREKVLQIHKEALVYYHHNLLSASEASGAVEYLKNRKISLDMVKLYRLGFGGRAWNGLYLHLTEKGFSEADIIKSGLVIKGAKRAGVDNFIDRFRERLIFPILDREGRCIGFGGRILVNKKEAAKYVNSPDSPIFHKGSQLFSLNFAKDEITKSREAILVEGYMDVIALFQHGIHNAVAPLGTSLTLDQLEIVNKFADSVLFIFDGDEAGITAANRALDIAVQSELKQSVVILPQKKDPYDFVMEFGNEGFLKYCAQRRLSPIDFKIRYFSKKIDLKSDRVAFLKALLPYVSRVKSSIIREDHLKRIAAFLNASLENILEEYNAFLKGDKSLGRGLGVEKNQKPRLPHAELEFAGLIAAFPERVNELRGLLSPDMLSSEEVKKLFEFVLSNTDKRAKDIVSSIENPEILETVSRYALTESPNPYLLLEVAVNLKINYIKKKGRAITKMLEQNRGNPEEQARLLTAQLELKKESEFLTGELKKLSAM